MVAVIYACKLVIGEQMILPFRLCILVVMGTLTYFLTLRLTYQPAYQQIVEVAQSALGGFLSRQA
jgi:hypothetical protein